ncbi:hypothetical protein [Apilactobacillus timberlakei]|uniref:hypothetical protein n=1 Tax=Apilactobacillus timberlakei TaxID=2008380 RepID=UPI001126715D|nr:hypothetical protein [Apilactobacillus timberlakei]TPR12139.1 hypothetical protein DYZ97_07670 [Apilactobacillus timberlakei]
MDSKRLKLKDLGNNERHTFEGTFERTGFKCTFGGGFMERTIYAPTLLLTNVVLADSGEELTSHLWFNYGKQFLKLGILKQGEKIKFNARVGIYKKGKKYARKTDYKLERPTKIIKLDNTYNGDIPINNNSALIGYIMDSNKKFYIENDRPYDPYYIDEFNKWNKENH